MFEAESSWYEYVFVIANIMVNFISQRVWWSEHAGYGHPTKGFRILASTIGPIYIPFGG